MSDKSENKLAERLVNLNDNSISLTIKNIIMTLNLKSMESIDKLLKNSKVDAKDKLEEP